VDDVAPQGDAVVHEIALVSGVHRLDARLHEPAGPPRGGIVVAHPHPLHGGHMDHPVVVCAAERAAALGLFALRFDFRGVQASEGNQADFAGHLEDWRQAAREVAARTPGGVHLGGGFSYGSRTLATVLDPDQGRRPDLGGLLLLAPATRVPTTRRDFGNLLLGRPLGEAARDARVIGHLGALLLPTQVLVGSEDVVAPADELRAALPAAAHLQVLGGLNHFFSRQTGAGALARDLFVPAVDRALSALIQAAPQRPA
jgi:alpha/beta superfamily hydrolase